MKPISLKILAVSLLMLLAGGSEARPNRPAPGSPARAEMKAYVRQNVLPMLRQQRQKLEPRLSTADRAQLATYRTELQTLRQQAHTFRQSLTSATDATRPALTPAQQQQRQQLHAATKAVLLHVAQLAQKYEADIRQLTQALQPQHDRWTTDLAAILARRVGTAAPAPVTQHHSGAASRLLRPVRFLLLNPAAATQDRAAASLYPNPAVVVSQLTYEVQKAGPVTIELLDGRGITLRTVAQESRQEKGPHTLPIDLSELPAGTYFYKISTRTSAETRRFVKE